MTRVVLLLLAASLVFAGCASTTAPPSWTPSVGHTLSMKAQEPDWAVEAIFGKGVDPEDNGRAMVEGHDHGNRTQHTGLSTPNFQVLGHDPLSSEYFEESPGSTYCGDVSNGTRQLAVVTSDLRSPARPVTTALAYVAAHDPLPCRAWTPAR